MLPPADYRVVTDEEIIEGLSFVAYHRVATSIFVPAPYGSAVEMARWLIPWIPSGAGTRRGDEQC